jgi:hypothetical protein
MKHNPVMQWTDKEWDNLCNAAPDMLAALKEVHELWSPAFPENFQVDISTGIGPTWAKVRAAIAKAEGK